MDDGIGIGWSFPPHFNYAGGEVIMTTGEADINGSLEVLFTTRLEERLFRPQYGANLESFLFKPLNAATVNQMTAIIGEAIRHFEPRINLRKVDVNGSTPAEGKLHVVIEYMIREDLSEDNSAHTFTYSID